MPKIVSIHSHKILNSRGSWTIQTSVTLDDGSVGIQAVPDGASKGDNESISLSIDKAIAVVETVLSEALIGKDPFDQQALDSLMITLDGTKNKKNLGGNSILSVSLAIARAAAKSRSLELYEYLSLMYSGQLKSHDQLVYPTPVFNILNGGKHANNGLSFQEFMVIPSRKIPYEKSLEMGAEIYQILKKELINKGFAVGVGDEGGFAPTGLTPETALAFLREAVLQKYKPGEDVFFGMDVASGSFFENESYVIPEEKLTINGSELQEYYSRLMKKYELIYIEDPFFERDFASWKEFFKTYGSKLMVVADDLAVTNVEFLKKVIVDNLANAVIVKPNQVGTLTETLEFIRMAKAANMSIIVSHRSGDTAEDTFISDLAVAVEADFIKSGAPVRGERVAKYNRLLEILAKK